MRINQRAHTAGEQRKREIMRKTLIIGAAVGVLLGAGVGSASAAPTVGGKANCVGAYTANYNQIGKTLGSPGIGGIITSEGARADGGMGETARDNACGPF
jgi:hypothetical protein